MVKAQFALTDSHSSALSFFWRCTWTYNDPGFAHFFLALPGISTLHVCRLGRFFGSEFLRDQRNLGIGRQILVLEDEPAFDAGGWFLELKPVGEDQQDELFGIVILGNSVFFAFRNPRLNERVDFFRAHFL